MNTAGWVTRNRRLILCIGAGLIVSWYVILVGAYVLVPALKGAIQTHAAEVLRAEFGSEVRFKSIEVTFWPRVHIVGGGVLIGNDTAHPLIQAATADATSDLLPWHIQRLVMTGLVLRIPTTPVRATATSKPAFALTIDDVTAEHAQLEILPSAGQQAPLHFELANLRVKNISRTSPADFAVWVVSSKPQVQIDTSGRVGPWNASDPGATPLQGAFKMSIADLATLPGLRGALVSEGRFKGVVKQIAISGDAVASEFGLSVTECPEPLHAGFQALLDASDGSVSIQRMSGSLRNSSFAAHGVVRDIPDDRLRDIVLNISVNDGRLEDVLPLAVKSRNPPISGALRLRAKLEIRPGEQEMVDRLRLDGDFGASNAQFSSLNLRDRRRKVSNNVSKMRGHVRLNNGTAEFSSLVIDRQGSSARLNGSYELASERLDVHGQLFRQARLSQATRVPRAYFLKAADHHVRRKHHSY
jgi:hypothetical protein